MDKDIQKKFAIINEVETSINLLYYGLREIQQINGANDFYHVAFLLLSSGFERLMKTIICFHHIKIHKEYPKKNIFPKGRKGHDLMLLLNLITTACFKKEYLKRPAAKEDLEYLKNDEQLHRFVKILSDFGQSARYHNLDVIIENESTTVSPEEQWQRMELEILKDIKDWDQKIMNPESMNKIFDNIIETIVIQFEKFARALCRLFTMGDLGEEASKNIGFITHFLFLSDSDLGNTVYLEKCYK